MGIITNKIYICLPFEKELDKLDWDGLSTEEYNSKTYYKIPSGGNGKDVVKKITFETLKNNVTVTLNIVSSSEARYDFAYACDLDGNSGYNKAKYKISGDNQSITCEYVVPTKGSHWIYIGYRKDSTGNYYNDCGYFSIDNLDKEYVIRQPKEVYLASNKMKEITYGSKKILEYGLTNNIYWETLTWDKSNNSYTYNTKGKLKISYNNKYTYLTNSPASMANGIYKLKFYNINTYYGNSYTCTYKLDLSDLDTSNITNMDSMFNGCGALTSVNVADWDTSKVTNMVDMFNGCESLTSLDLSSFDTSKVTDMNYMFKSCEKLASLDVSKWNVSNVTNMRYMFCFCNNLASLDVSKWDVSNVTNMSTMFRNCEKLASLDVSKWNVSHVNYMDFMFTGCEKLASLDVSKWDVSNVTNMDYMFYYCNNLASLDVSKWDVSKVTNMSNMFYNCNNLASLDVSKWDVSNVTNMSNMFIGCTELKTLIAGHESETNVTALNGLKVDIDLSYCTKLNAQSITAICMGLVSLPSDNNKTITVSKTKESDISVQIAMLNARAKNWNTVYK